MNKSRAELCMEACDGLASEDLAYLLSIGRNLKDEIDELDQHRAYAVLVDIGNKRHETGSHAH